MGYHLLDVGAAMEAILRARPVALRRVARLLRLEEHDARLLLVTLAGLHDLGKFAPAFQAQVPELWNPLRVRLGLSDPLPGRHTEDGYSLWVGEFQDRFGERIWTGAQRALEALAPGIFGHHGRPSPYLQHRYSQGFPLPVLAAARACGEAIVALLSPHTIESAAPEPRDARVASWYVAGLMTTADWIGSRAGWFPYTSPRLDDPTLAGYWSEVAQPAAERAVREAGILAPPPAPRRAFRDVTGLERAPTPLQDWAETIELPDSPCLVVIEDVTGAGKTEAAQMLVHRLLVAGRVAGAYWAMPTQATANAMYARQAKMLDNLFADEADPRPSLVLAHAQQRLHPGFRSTVLTAAPEGEPAALSRAVPDSDDELPGGVACAAFLADDRRAALLADVGSGTIDQAVLGVLPSKFNTVRLFGLADKVLVVDEAHAFDVYIHKELQALLRFQAALGGCAVVLSATLPQARRAELASAWLDGLLLGGWSPTVTGVVDPESLNGAYPLATLATGDGVRETSVATADWSHRKVDVHLLHEVSVATEHVVKMAAAGAAVAWIRNTVDDCLAAAEALRGLGVKKVIVFHARFAHGDRLAREEEVLQRFGKNSSVAQRAGWVLIATQVVEQSLDLDFDVMISDLAPVDLLIQRAGRLWRHSERNRARRRLSLRLELMVLSPPRNPDPPQDWLSGTFRGTAAVYRHHGVLWRTVEVLSKMKCIESPGGLRALVEAVYGSDEVPDTLLRAAQRAEAQDLSDASTAQYGTLKVPHGYDASDQPWVDDLRVPTRLGDETTTIRLARLQPDGSLAPWANAEPAWRAWALSEVRVRANRVPTDAAPAPEYAPAADAARRDWGRYEQDIPLLALQLVQSGLFGGELVEPKQERRIAVRYSPDEGLVFHNER